ncbi:MAG: phosphoribosylanthranilate isomerase [Candidatus Omnitrophota bacterium]|nr:phosphoribosylanthranilate isomerase [Candidatus Omnitrophota bacterium]
MVKVKICGITNLEDAKASIDAGCDALGFVFYKKSPRYIAPEKVKDIIKSLPENIAKIGVFVNSREKTIKKIANSCGFDILQFHGDESVSFCRKFKGYKIIKVISIKDKVELKHVLNYNPFAYLFDAFCDSKRGGSGKRFDWKLLRHLYCIKKPVFLSGGLTVDNVKEAVKTARPDWVDASSSLEIAPGKKDHQKIKDFIRMAKE